MSETPVEAEQERHASWAELFFDLVAVAGVAALSHVLHDDVSLRSLTLFVVMFLAFWLCWISYMVYGNVVAEGTRLVHLLLGMFGLGVMAASAPGVAETLLHHGHEDGAVQAFVIAYVFVRIAGSRSWTPDQVIVDFPIVQVAFGALPWVVSLWVDAPWKFALWGLGVVLDLFMILVYSGDDALGGAQKRLDEQRARSRRRLVLPETVAAVHLDAHHLAERLGLFVIIVLGEGVITVVRAAWEVDWDGHLLVAGVASFVLLACMFALSVLYGYAGLPHLRAGALPLRGTLALHGGVTLAIVALAAALGTVVEHGGEPLSDSGRWLLCGSVIAYFVLGLGAALAGRALDARAAAWWLLTGVVVPVLLGVLGGDRGGSVIVAYAALAVLLNLRLEGRADRRDGAPFTRPRRPAGQG